MKMILGNYNHMLNFLISFLFRLIQVKNTEIYNVKIVILNKNNTYV